MADYKAIHGKNIQHLASDLDNAEGEGQIWFNTTTSDYKTIVKVAGAWASGGDLNTLSSQGAGFGIQTAAVVTGGEEPSPGVAICEAYNGTVWSTFPNMANGRYNHNAASAGTQALGLVSYAPGDTNGTEEFTGGSTALNVKTVRILD